MKNGFLFGIFVLLLLPFALATECDDFCADEGYNYGECRDTVEDGFCEGNTNEKVFGFSQCTNIQRCCCGNDDGVVPEETVKEKSDFSVTAFAENSFWFLLAIVALLGLAVIINKVAFNDKEKKDEKNEE
ncbi:hypothetical protein J4467_02760 [Candidatus Woesearchaeota archaeon]|nr:hypothetical protein [Candidatus Woesearchaeota archaeon]